MQFEKDSPHSHMQSFVRAWYQPTDLVRIWAKPPSDAVDPKAYEAWKHSKTWKAQELIELPEEEFFGWAKTGLNFYVGVNPHKVDLGEGSKRGGKDDVQVIRGFYLDLDIGKGFRTPANIRDFILKLGFEPTMIVSTGSGGQHAYYRLKNDLEATAENEEYLKMFHEYAKGVAGFHMDFIMERARVLRLPGTYRNDKGIKGVVRLLYVSEARIDLDDVVRLSQPYYKAVQEAEEKQREVNRERTEQQRSVVRSSGVGLEDLEEWCNSWEWEDILQGWTKYGTPDAEGRQQWTRPHGPEEVVNGKSAVTDWEESPNMLSLFSDSEDTGLKELKAERVPLSKMQCILTLHYDNDALAMVMDFEKDKQN